MKTMKLLRFAAALLVGFAAGAYAVRLLPKSQPAELRRLGESVEFSKPLYAQYSAGDYEQGRAAMLALVSHLDEYAAESERCGVSYYNADAMMAHVRLAKLEEGRDGAARADFMREAVARCERLRAAGGWRRACDESYLRGEVDRSDALIER